jgi:dCMP deaminase
MLDRKWDLRFIELANHVSSWSKDPSTKVGAVIVTEDRRVLSMGYNGFPRGCPDREEDYANREVKLKLVSHAERNALDNVDVSVRGCTLYTTHFPCNECAKSIVQKGITRVVSPFIDNDDYHTKFHTSETKHMFRYAGVVINFYTYPFTDIA